jgi:hypothetical protein
MTTLVTWEEIINEHRCPLAILAQADLLCSLMAEFSHHHNLLNQIFSFRQHCKSTQEPTIAQHTCTSQIRTPNKAIQNQASLSFVNS